MLVDGSLGTRALIAFDILSNFILDLVVKLERLLGRGVFVRRLGRHQLGVFSECNCISIPRSYLLQSERCFPY